MKCFVCTIFSKIFIIRLKIIESDSIIDNWLKLLSLMIKIFNALQIFIFLCWIFRFWLPVLRLVIKFMYNHQFHIVAYQLIIPNMGDQEFLISSYSQKKYKLTLCLFTIDKLTLPMHAAVNHYKLFNFHMLPHAIWCTLSCLARTQVYLKTDLASSCLLFIFMCIFLTCSQPVASVLWLHIFVCLIWLFLKVSMET